MVVDGRRHVGRTGHVLQKDTSKAKAVVQLSGDLQAHIFSYDDICQFVGPEVMDDF